MGFDRDALAQRCGRKLNLDRIKVGTIDETFFNYFWPKEILVGRINYKFVLTCFPMFKKYLSYDNIFKLYKL